MEKGESALEEPLSNENEEYRRFFPHRGTRRNMKTRCTRKPRLASAKNSFSALARARCCPKMWKTLCWYADAHRFSGKSGNGSLPPFFTRSITIGFPPECGCESCLEYFPQDARRNVRDLPFGFCTRHNRRKPKTARIANGFCTPHLWPHFLRPHQHRKRCIQLILA